MSGAKALRTARGALARLGLLSQKVDSGFDSSGNPIAAKLVGDAEAQVTGRSGPFKGYVPVGPRSSANFSATTRASASTHTEFVCPFDVVAIIPVFSSSQKVNFATGGSGGVPFPFTTGVKSAVQMKGALLSSVGATVRTTDLDLPIAFSFGGKTKGVVRRGKDLYGDMMPLNVKAGQRNFIVTYQENQYPVPPAPASFAVGTGGALGAGVYVGGYTIVYYDDMESPCSIGIQSAAVSSNGKLTIPKPTAAAYPSARGWKPWLSTAGAVPTGTTYRLYETLLGELPLDVDAVITQGISASNGASPNKLPSVITNLTSGIPSQLPTGYAAMGGSGPGASDNGEGVVVGQDRTVGGILASPGLSSTGWGPVALLALPADGMPRASMVIIGDSTSSAGVGDEGFLNGSAGGWIARALMGQITRYAYDPSIAPIITHLELGCGGETGATYLVSDSTRRERAALCTSVICTYGTNDLNNLYCSQVIPTTLAIARLSTDQGQYFTQTALLPKNISSDGFRTLANQSLPAAGLTMAVEGSRRQFNSWLTVGPSAPVTGEAMFGEYATAAPATNLYGGGNGGATKFQTRLPFRTGTEVIKVAGATQVVTTNYTYLGSQIINGQTYASGVQFTGAPVNAASVTADYTPIDGFKTLAGPLADVSTIPSSQEVNGAGVVTMNGGFWKPATEAALVTGTSSGGNSTTAFNDTSKTWQQDQWRGYSVRILTDTSTPTSVGQIRTITANSPTGLTLGGGDFLPVPSAAATYEIYNPYTGDGVHAKARSQIEMALQFNPAAVR